MPPSVLPPPTLADSSDTTSISPSSSTNSIAPESSPTSTDASNPSSTHISPLSGSLGLYLVMLFVVLILIVSAGIILSRIHRRLRRCRPNPGTPNPTQNQQQQHSNSSEDRLNEKKSFTSLRDLLLPSLSRNDSDPSKRSIMNIHLPHITLHNKGPTMSSQPPQPNSPSVWTRFKAIFTRDPNGLVRAVTPRTTIQVPSIVVSKCSPSGPKSSISPPKFSRARSGSGSDSISTSRPKATTTSTAPIVTFPSTRSSSQDTLKVPAKRWTAPRPSDITDTPIEPFQVLSPSQQDHATRTKASGIIKPPVRSSSLAPVERRKDVGHRRTLSTTSLTISGPLPIAPTSRGGRNGERRKSRSTASMQDKENVPSSRPVFTPQPGRR